MMKNRVLSHLFLLASLWYPANACSDILVTPLASADGSAMIAYNADDTALYGVLYHYPASTGKENETVQVYDWDTGKYLGEIPQVNETYNVVGNGNEHGLVIGESTFGGVSELANQPGAIIDYGSLIYLTLQRAKTARQAIATMNDLMNTCGYYSQGESISIADMSGEVWIMEVIGRGETYGKKGAVWVARKIPDGYMTAHANQARITTFPRDDPETCLYAPDVVDVAVHYGLYQADQDPLSFSFSDVYDPVSFTHARFSEARVWSIFSKVADQDGSFQLKYQDYAAGRDVSQRMPLFIKPYKKLALFDVMNLMNSHYEGTELDSTKDIGSGLFETPHRPRPLTWEFQGKTYFNERNVATYRTGWNFVAQLRPSMPRELSVLIWFAVDDSSTSPRFPVYASSTAIAEPYAGKGTQDGVPGPMLKLDMKKAFWVQNMVSNLCYWRWKDMYPVLRQKIDSVHAEFAKQVHHIDGAALAIDQKDSPAAAVEYVTKQSVAAGETLHQEWLNFYGEMFVRFRDFSIITPNEENTRCGCDVKEPGLSEETKKRIVMETGTHYEVTSPETKKDDGARLGSPSTGPKLIHIKDVY